jgi:hypothetical protein
LPANFFILTTSGHYIRTGNPSPETDSAIRSPADRTAGGTVRLSGQTSHDLSVGSLFEEFAFIRKSVYHELGSAIPGPRSLIVPRGDGPTSSVTNSVQSIDVDAQVDEKIFN